MKYYFSILILQRKFIKNQNRQFNILTNLIFRAVFIFYYFFNYI